MYKKSNNPEIEELTKSHKGRRINLSVLKDVAIDGNKACVWCLAPLKGRRYRWCSALCGKLAFAWANPQKEHGLNILLVRQDWKCNICNLDWKVYALEIYAKKHPKEVAKGCPNFGKEYDYRLMKRLKYELALNHKPEVDHIVAISKGGASLGFSNHQAICFLCHKAKTKVDNSGPRKPRK